MKANLQKLLGAFIVMGSLTVFSCQPNKCTSVICANSGVCNSDGSCTCATGYEGERCESATRDKFKGSWNVVEDGTGSNPAIYTLAVSNAPIIDQVYITNFNNFANSQVTAKVLGDTIYIPNQLVEQDGVVKSVEGKGYIVPESYYDLHGKLIVKYRVIDDEGNVNDYGYQGGGKASEWSK